MIALEPRVMLDGAIAMAAVEAEAAEPNQDSDRKPGPDPAAQNPNSDTEAGPDHSGIEAGDASTGRPASGRTLVIVDAAVRDAADLLAGIDPSAEIFTLQSGTDGVSQITDILSGLDGVSALHLLSHGATGSIILGSTILDAANVETYTADFVAWDVALAEGADILLYGCNVTEDRSGLDFIDLFADLTNADVAASSDITGAAALGGNWSLESTTGAVAPEVPFADAALAGYAHSLATFTVTTTVDDPFGGGTLAQETADGGGLSLREAIGLANAGARQDTIVFDDAVFDAGNRIVLTEATRLQVTNDLVIDGAIDGGSATVTIDGNITGGSRGETALLGVFSSADLTLRNLTLAKGQATAEGGGAIFAEAGTNLTIEAVTFDRNEAFQQHGGAIHLQGSASLTINDSTFLRNATTGGVGGAIFAGSATDLAIENTLFSQNTAGRSDTVGNQALNSHGGGLYLSGGSTTTINASEFRGNVARRDGGGILFAAGSGSLTVTNSTFEDNTALRNGAGMALFGETTMRSSTISANKIIFGNDGGSSGGGLYVGGGSVAIHDTTISGNTVKAIPPSPFDPFPTTVARGAGLMIAGDARTVTLVNSTVFGNSANISGPGAPNVFQRGGGVSIDGNEAALVAINSTIAGNSADGTGNQGGNIDIDDGDVTLLNTFVGDETGGGNIFGAPVLVQDSFIGDGGGLGPLQDNGGPTQTAMPNSSSPLIDAGSAAHLLAVNHGLDIDGAGIAGEAGDDDIVLDQRGGMRIDNGAVDIGAVEVGGFFNDAPVVTAPAAALAATEQTPLDLHNRGFSVTEADEEGAVARAILSVGEGSIAVSAGDSGVSGVAATNNSASVTLTGTIARINALLTGAGTGTIVYTNSSDAPAASTTVTVTVNDQGSNGADPGRTGDDMSEEGSASQTIEIAGVNDDPGITGLDGDALAYNEGAGPRLLDQGTAAAIVDPDSADFSGGVLNVAIAAGKVAAEDRLAFDSSGTVSVAGRTVRVGGTQVGMLSAPVAAGIDLELTLNANANQARIATLLQSLTYENLDTDNPTVGDRMVRITISDGDTGTAPAADVTVTVNRVNDAPEIADLAADNAIVIAGGPSNAIDVGGNALVSDPDGPADFDGGFITFDITAGTDNGTFSFGTPGVTSGGGGSLAANETVAVGGVDIGTVSNVAGQDGQTGNFLRIDFSAGATPAALSTLIRSLHYSVPSGFGDRTLTTTLNDGDGNALGGDPDTVIVSTIDVPVAPQVQSIVRQDPVAGETNRDAVTFRVTFDSDVVNVGTNDFALSGTLSAASTITGVTRISDDVYDVLVDVPDNGDGTVNLDIAVAPTVENALGNPLLGSAVPLGADETFTIDNTPPAVPTADLAAASDRGVSDTDDITNDDTPIITGTVDADTTVRIVSSIDGLVGQDSAANYNADGIDTTSLSDGVHTLTIEATDRAGNTSSTAIVITIDTIAPVADTILSPLSPPDDVTITFSETITFNPGAATYRTTLNAGALVQETFVADNVNTVLSGGDTLTITRPTALPFGSTFSAQLGAGLVTDIAGNDNAALNDLATLVFETFPIPLAPTGLDLVTTSDTGRSDADNITADNTPTITGTADANAIVTLRSSIAGVIGQTVAEADGTWSITTQPLGDGVHSITATATNPATTGPASAALTMTIDSGIATPDAPDLVAGSDLGTSDTDNVTSDETPSFSGMAEAGALVTLTSSLSGDVATGTADTAGRWTLTSTALPLGDHVFTVSAEDLAGNISPVSAGLTVTIEDPTTLVSTGTDGRTAGGSGSQTGPTGLNSGNGGDITIGGQPTGFAGGAPTPDGPAGFTGQIGQQRGQSADPIITGGTGSGDPLPGNGLSESDLPGTLKLLPTSDTGFSNSDAVTRDVTPTLAGEAPANATVTIRSSLGGILGTARVDENGRWRFTSPALADGVHELIATPKDEDGKEGTPSLPLLVTIDTERPVRPAPPSFDGDIDQLRAGANAPFSGTAEPGARIVLTSDPDGVVGETIADENGNWSLSIAALSEKGHALSVTATDPAGNTSDPSPALEIRTRGADDSALNFDPEEPVRVEIAGADDLPAFETVDLTLLLHGFRDPPADRTNGSSGFTRQLQMAGSSG